MRGRRERRRGQGMERDAGARAVSAWSRVRTWAERRRGVDKGSGASARARGEGMSGARGRRGRGGEHVSGVWAVCGGGVDSAGRAIPGRGRRGGSDGCTNVARGRTGGGAR